MLCVVLAPQEPVAGAVEVIGPAPRPSEVPQLVRVPIVWRGETKKALALRLFVEQEGADGKWQAAPVVR